MDYHVASSTEYQYTPEYMTCDLTYYTDISNCNTGGLLVGKLQTSPQLHLSSFRQRISANDLSSFYLSDLISLLNSTEDTYKEVCKRHKKCTGAINFINYEELRHAIECVSSLSNMSKRLKIVGCTAPSVFSDSGKLNAAVCLQGNVSHPDNFVVERSNFVDTKIDSFETIVEFMTTGIKHQSICTSSKQHRYGLSGCIIYLIILKRADTFDFIIYLSEDPISKLIQYILEFTDTDTNTDFIYTVIGRTCTEEESYPYIICSEGIKFKDIIIECNECCFSQPILSTYKALHSLVQNTIQSNKEALKLLTTEDDTTFPSLKSLFLSSLPVDYNINNDKLFDILVNNRANTSVIPSQLKGVSIDETLLSGYSVNSVCKDPSSSTYELVSRFVNTYVPKLDLKSLKIVLSNLYQITRDTRFNEIENRIQSFVQEKENIIEKALTGYTTQFDTAIEDEQLTWDLSY